MYFNLYKKRTNLMDFDWFYQLQEIQRFLSSINIYPQFSHQNYGD